MSKELHYDMLSTSKKRIFFYSFYNFNTIYKTSTDSPFVFNPHKNESYELNYEEIKSYILKNQSITQIIRPLDIFQIVIINIGSTDCKIYFEDSDVILTCTQRVKLVHIQFLPNSKIKLF